MQINQQLSLEPITGQHYPALSKLFDTDIQHQVHLPKLAQPEEWVTWISGQKAQGHEHFAITESGLGCLGASGFEHCRSCDLFYFWLGASHRGQGRGHLIADYIKTSFPDKRPIYALTFADNMASLNTFKKAQWYALELRIALSGAPVCVLSHCWVDDQQAKSQLAESFVELGSDLQVIS